MTLVFRPCLASKGVAQGLRYLSLSFLSRSTQRFGRNLHINSCLGWTRGLKNYSKMADVNQMVEEYGKRAKIAVSLSINCHLV